MTGIFRAAAGLLTGGKYHWRTIATGLIGFNPNAGTGRPF